jgi:type IV pilus assembly protein PilY1
MKSNKTTYVYGGDLLGNVWRFDINAASSLKFAVLKDSGGNVQPVTTAPELGLINYKRVVFVGTGKYLELADLSDTQTQSLYAIKDDDTGVTFDNPRASLVSQTITDSSTTGTRTATNTAVDFSAGRGWYVDFPDSKERVHINPKLDSGTLFVATTVPSSTTCSPGGIGWLNYFNYMGGTAINGTTLVGQKFDGPIVGTNIFYTPDNKRHVTVVTANNPTPTPPALTIPSPSASGFLARRAIWREITP